MRNTTVIMLLCLAGLGSANAQEERISMDKAVETALKNNQQLDINEAEIRTAGLNVKTAVDIPKTGIFAENEDLRPSDNTGILKIGISQSVAWPGLYAARKDYFNNQLKFAELNKEVLNATIRREVRTAYYKLWYLQDKQLLYKSLDSIYTLLFKTAEVRLKAGDVAALDKIAAEAKLQELKAFSDQNKKEMTVQQQQLMMLLNQNEWLLPVETPLEKATVILSENNGLHPLLILQEQNIKIAESNVFVQKNSNRPEFSGRIFSQRLWGANDPYTGFSAIASFPLFGAGYARNKVKAASAEQEVQKKNLAYQTRQMQAQKASSVAEIEKNLSLLNYYETTGLKQAEEIIKASALSYRAGEISFAELGQFLSQAVGIRQNYLDILNQYNQSVVQFNYFNNK